jgi:pentatricopeptide repeat protein
MTQRNIQPNERSYSSLIQLSFESGNVEAALSIVDHMKKIDIKPTEITYSLVLHGLGRSGELEKVDRVLQVMKSEDMRPNVVTMSSLIDSFGRLGHFEKALFLFKEMQNSNDLSNRYMILMNSIFFYFSIFISLYFFQSPNSITFSSVIDICLKANQIDLALQMVREMKQSHIPLNEVTYTSLITELTRLRGLDRIFEIVTEESGFEFYNLIWIL